MRGIPEHTEGYAESNYGEGREGERDKTRIFNLLAVRHNLNKHNFSKKEKLYRQNMTFFSKMAKNSAYLCTYTIFLAE